MPNFENARVHARRKNKVQSAFISVPRSYIEPTAQVRNLQYPASGKFPKYELASDTFTEAIERDGALKYQVSELVRRMGCAHEEVIDQTIMYLIAEAEKEPESTQERVYQITIRVLVLTLFFARQRSSAIVLKIAKLKAVVRRKGLSSHFIEEFIAIEERTARFLFKDCSDLVLSDTNCLELSKSISRWDLSDKTFGDKVKKSMTTMLTSLERNKFLYYLACNCIALDNVPHLAWILLSFGKCDMYGAPWTNWLFSRILSVNHFELLYIFPLCGVVPNIRTMDRIKLEALRHSVNFANVHALFDAIHGLQRLRRIKFVEGNVIEMTTEFMKHPKNTDDWFELAKKFAFELPPVWTLNPSTCNLFEARCKNYNIVTESLPLKEAYSNLVACIVSMNRIRKDAGEHFCKLMQRVSKLVQPFTLPKPLRDVP